MTELLVRRFFTRELCSAVDHLCKSHPQDPIIMEAAWPASVCAREDALVGHARFREQRGRQQPSWGRLVIPDVDKMAQKARSPHKVDTFTLDYCLLNISSAQHG